MNEARIKTNFGEIVIPYANLDELKKALDELPNAVTLVQSKTVGLVAAELRKPRPGLENVYEFDSNGRPRLLKKPTKKLALTAMALYASDPEPMSASDLGIVTGIVDVVKSVVGQTLNKKYFVARGDGKYGLSPIGFQWVVDRVVPVLRA